MRILSTANQSNIRNGSLPICNIKIKTDKPCYLPFPAKDDTTLGAKLKRQRLTLEWTQKDTAKHFGVLKDSYQKWEWNQGIPHIKNRKRVVEFLNYNYWDDGSNSLANRCLLFRIEKGIIRSELAKLIGISEMTMDKVEDNKRNISQETIKKIKKILIFH